MLLRRRLLKLKIIENRIKVFVLSLVIILIGIGFSIYNISAGNAIFNFDVDFSGGTSLQYDLKTEANGVDVERIISSVEGVSSPRVQAVLGTTQFTIKTLLITDSQQEEIHQALSARYEGADLLESRRISPTISAEMQQKAIVSVLLTCLAVLVYISFRFKNIKMGAAALLALAHDVLVLLVVYVVFRVPVNNSFIAAILTILGYSLNATIVVFDRVRENKKYIKSHEMENLINSSINQTLTRSINTSATSLITISCVFIFGVASVREFAFPLIIGIISGTYSSVFFAGSVWYVLVTKKLIQSNG
jgi:preprotein translocase SecF subunit